MDFKGMKRLRADHSGNPLFTRNDGSKARLQVEHGKGTHWYVDGGSGALAADGTGGSDNNDGKSWATAVRTWGRVDNYLGSGDVVHIRGNIREQVTTPAGVFDVTVIGMGNRPRHADAHTIRGYGQGGYSGATWKAPASPTAATPLIKVQQQGWRFVNMLFVAPTDNSDLNAAIQLFRDAGADDAERDASHAEFIGCRFAGGRVGINDTGGCYGVGIYDCRFHDHTNWAILGVGNIGVGQSQWIIEGNHFAGFTNGVKIAGFACRIIGNTFTDGGTPNTTVVLNISNGGGQDNFVVDNYFQTATANFNSPDVVGNATDVWWNVSIDAAAAGVSSGHEVGQPA